MNLMDPGMTNAHAPSPNYHSGTASIEQGYFVFTLMPSLFCKLRCPHCYLSLAQRQDKTIMSVEDLTTACKKVDAYYDKQKVRNKTIICYWYGGEPTSMGQEYFIKAAEAINATFSPDKGYDVKHTVLSALVGVKPDWFPIFDKYGKGEVQSSYDGLMRGEGYMRAWDKNVRAAAASGLRVSTISVVNEEILRDGPVKTLDYLTDLGVAETSWLPFMWNEQNDGEQYDTYAPTMARYSEFMIGLTEYWISQREAGVPVPEIGQMRFILGQKNMPLLSNIAGQTLFLLPNGDFVLPDYVRGWQEYMNKFGNILEQDFEAVLKSPARRKYLRRQVSRNGNAECLSCNHVGNCVMEFWKDNRDGDDCFGASRYVDWLLPNAGRIEKVAPGAPTLY